MSDAIEQLVRDAGDRAVPPLDVSAVHDRARARRRARRMWRAVAAGAAGALVAVTAIALAGTGGDTTRRIDTARSPPTFTRTHGIPEARTINGLASNGSVTVAVGTFADQTSPAGETIVGTGIWRSTDARHWTRVLSTAPILVYGPPRDATSLESLGGVWSTSGGFVALGSTNGSGAGAYAAVWTSVDGASWQQADPQQFVPEIAPPEQPVGANSEIADLAVRGGTLVGVGSIYTNSSQPDGGQPCIWLSPDGRHWTHRVIDLGKGFDPNVGSIAVHDRTVYLAGHVDRTTGVVWSSRDLVHWRRVVVDADAGIGLAETPRGLFGIGARFRTKGNVLASAVPTIWRVDGARWRVVFRTHRTAQESGFAYFRSDGRTFVAALRAKQLQLFGSTDGTHWRRLSTANSFPPLTTISAMASIGGHIVIAGYVQDNSVPFGRKIPYFWTADG